MDDTDSNPKQQLQIEFSNQAAIKEMAGLPQKVRSQFIVNLEMLKGGVKPELKIDHLSAVGPGVIELKINGSPAYRLIYSTKFPGKIVVLAVRAKTTQGQDKKLIKVAALRLKAYGK